MDDALRFIQVGELAKGISEEVLPHVDDLAGTSAVLGYEDGSAMRLVFGAGGTLSWAVESGPRTGEHGEEVCRITRPRPGLYVADYLAGTHRATAMTAVLDLEHGAATLVAGTLPTAEQAAEGAFSLATRGAELTLVRCAIVQAAIDRPFDAAPHPHVPTADLVGKRVEYVYSGTEKYEHIYLNEDLYTW